MEVARQIAALPVRRGTEGSFLVLLVTSRETGRWVIPKGWPWPDREEWASAAEEAWEEAGVLGKADQVSIGSYRYRKRQPLGTMLVDVTVYRLEVTEQLAIWPECEERQRSWFGPTEAAAVVAEPGLQELIRRLASESTA
jgi:8-oxo-dGTP pyrophosphatase MutT (NUDIX family)